MNRKAVLARFREVLVDFPALVKLIYRLLKDRRVSPLDKAILAGIIAYVLNPIDLVVDFIPVIGQIDDALLVALGLLRLLKRADEQILTEHWEGRYEILPLLDEIVELASAYLPASVQRAILGKLTRN
ncbi:MAG: YkvA family protein [Acidobacteriota bacterium]